MARNVLFVTIDQLRADCLFGELARYVPTPNLDRFAARSTVFARHFTVTCPCGPARASLLTGLYAMNHRSVRNGTPLASHHTNIAKEVRKGGIEPLLFGYTDTQVDPTTRDAGDPDLAVYESVMPGFREIVEMRLENGYEWPAYLASKGYKIPNKLPKQWLKLHKPKGGKLGGPALYDAADSDTAYLTDATIKQLSPRRGWFAHVTYIRPHPPLVAPDPYHKLIDPSGLPEPLRDAPDHSFMRIWLEDTAQKGLYYGFDGNCAGMDEATTQLLRGTYLGLIAELDHHLGRLLDWVQSSGQGDETLIVITSDHGEMLGDKKMWGKKSVFDQAYHVPLMIFDPKGKPAKVDVLSESVDVTPTILDWLGLPVPPAMDGHSLLPWLRGKTGPARDAVFMEIELGNPGKPSRFEKAWGVSCDEAAASILRTERYKYVHFAGGVAPMLFDLEQDPGEADNLAGRPEHVETQMGLMARLIDRRMRRQDRRLTGFIA